MDISPIPLTFEIDASLGTVSALALVPPTARALYVMAHGAGAGMHHAFMATMATLLAERGVATVRYQFPSMERGARRPDSPAAAHATVRAAVALARDRWPRLPLLAGGKSFGARMTSQAHALTPLAGVRGLVFLGFPLHPAGKPGVERANHLAQAAGPLLFVQGTRDELADLALLRSVVQPLGPRATLSVFNDADHAFHVRAKSGTTDALTHTAMADVIAQWAGTLDGVDAAASTPLTREARRP